MQTVIAGYASFEQAKQAVRSLEPSFSTQDIVIADRNQQAWRQFRPQGEIKLSISGPPRFLVVMSGEVDNIERARAMLAGSGEVATG